MRILVVEDDAETAAYITHGFAEEGHVVEALDDGRDGLSQAMGETYDIPVSYTHLTLPTTPYV